jgi:hypothetical protein
MSIFASQTSVTIPIPFDDPHTVTIRKLTGRELERAQAEHMRSMVGGRSVRGWSGAFQRILNGLATPADAQQVLADPLGGYDRTTIVRAGLISWSYPQAIAPLTPSEAVDRSRTDAVEDLDDEALEFLATEILRRTKPGLFHTTAADAEAEKKSA